MKKYSHILFAIAILTCGLVVFLKTVENPSAYSQRLPASVRAALENAQLAKIARQEARELLEKERSTQDRLTLIQRGEMERANMSARDDATFWGVFTVCALSVLMVVGGLIVTSVKISTANPDAIVLGMMTLFPKSKEHYRFLTESKRFERDYLKLNSGGIYATEQDKQHAIEIFPETPKQIPDALECFERGMIPKDGGNFLHGLHTQEGDNVHINFQESKTGMKIIGDQGFGKSNTLCFFAGQALYKGWGVLCIDIHHPGDESFVAGLGALADTPNVKVFAEEEEIIQAFCFLDKLLKYRLANKPDVPVLIEIDELLGTLHDLKNNHDVNAEATIYNILTQGRKADMWLVGAGHLWKAKKITTDIKNAMKIQVLHKTAKQEGKIFCDDLDAAKKAENLTEGQTITILPDRRIVPVTVPLWTSDAANRVLRDMKITEFPEISIAEEEVQAFGRVTVLDDYRGEPAKKNRWI